MEKLVVKKIKSNKKDIDKKPLQRQYERKQKKSKKPSLIMQFFCQHKKFIIFLSIEFLLISIFLFLSFFNSRYFLFLNRPKIFQTSNLLCFLLFLYIVFNNLLPFLSCFVYFKAEGTDKIKKTYYEKSRKNIIKFSAINSVIICLVLIGFLCKVLWLCVFMLFALFATSFVEIFKQPTGKLTFCAIVKFLLAIILLLSIYYIYLLN